MKKSFVFLITLFYGFSFSLLAKENTSHLFQENKGQVFDQNHQLRNDILFYGTSQDFGFYVKKNGVSYQLYKAADTSKNNPSVTIQRVDISWTGANENPTIITENPATAVNNYYTVDVPALNVKSYEQFRFQDLYNGIDLKYYQQNGSLKYDYIIHPHADYHQIQLHVEGAELSFGKDGAVTLKTPLGNITEGQPIAYQNGQIVSVKWVLSNNTLSFQIPDYNSSEELVIDPLVFAGAPNCVSIVQPNGAMYPIGAVYDQNGNNFKYGYYATDMQSPSNSIGFIGKYDINDGHVYTNSVNGSYNYSLGLFSYVKGAGVDSIGNVYYSGSTTTYTNLATTGAFQTVWQGSVDGFLIKMTNDGIKLWGTYYGGSANDTVNSCVVDKNGSSYLFGTTRSPSVFASQGSFQPNIGGLSDAFLAKFNSDGYRIWGTYFGGINEDFGRNMSIDYSKNVIYVCGITRSSLGITTPNSFQPYYTGTNNVGFLAMFDSSGQRIWSTYIGVDSTTTEGLTTSNKSDIYITGTTKSNSGIATVGTSQHTLSGLYDGYLMKFDSSGQRIWGTYLGGSKNDFSTACAVDTSGHVFICGTTYSNDNIATTGAYITTGPGGLSFAMLMEFDTTGNKKWGTYCLNTNASSAGQNCYTDIDGIVYLCGYAVAHVGNLLTYLHTGSILRFSQFTSPPPPISAYPYVLCKDKNVVISTTNVLNGIYQWYHNNLPIPSANAFQVTVDSTGDYYVQVTINSSTKNSPTLTLNNATPLITTISSTNISCGGKADGVITINASGGLPPYIFTANADTVLFNAHNYGPNLYSIITTDSNGCYVADTVTITEPPVLGFTNTVTDEPCYSTAIGAIDLSIYGGIPPYHTIWNNLSDTTPYLHNIHAGTYFPTVSDSINCKASYNIVVNHLSSPMPTNPLVSICAVTVDSFENKNRIVWEKGGNSHASAYNIYREGTVAEQYDLIGIQASDKYTAYLDSNANPLQQSYRYKITETDSCGNEFSKSAYHQTIHLSASSGINGEVNLSWNLYEGVGFNTQYIKRSINGNAFETIAQVASTTTSYTDANPPTGQKDYRIAIDLPNGCVYNSFHQIASNAITFNPNGSTVHVFPNPTSDILNIRGTIPSKIVLEDLAGKKVLEEGKTNELSIHSLATGMYLIKLFDNNGNCYYRSKIVKH